MKSSGETGCNVLPSGPRALLDRTSFRHLPNPSCKTALGSQAGLNETLDKQSTGVQAPVSNPQSSLTLPSQRGSAGPQRYGGGEGEHTGPVWFRTGSQPTGPRTQTDWGQLALEGEVEPSCWWGAQRAPSATQGSAPCFSARAEGTVWALSQPGSVLGMMDT